MNIGSRVSHYRITSKLGEGGMGEVYGAEDERLKRDVAIKVLPDSLSKDPERVARLEREAQTLARLDHANIATIYGLERAEDGTRFLVMQLAEGRTLASRIDEGPVPLEEALPIAVQIARALEAAHEEGVVHRDLKPANVMLGSDGTVRLLDFGLAKGMGGVYQSGSHEVSASPTALQVTNEGVILGTAGYMSPEQARGQRVDRRTDVWAFGCVLYEMLTGERVFGGQTMTDVLGAIVHRDPDWEALPADTPRRIRALLHRCLRKDADRRIQAIGDARVSIEEYLEDPVAAEAILDHAAASGPAWKQWVPWGVAALMAVVAVVLGMQTGGPATEDRPVMRMETTIDVVGGLVTQRLGSTLTISPDGRRLIVVRGNVTGGTSSLAIRRLDSPTFTDLAGNGAYHPFFSPDSQWVGFATSSGIYKVPASGGTPQRIAEASRSRGAAWLDDGTIVLAGGSVEGLGRVSSSGGDVTALTVLDTERGEVTHRWPQALPGGTHVLFTAHNEATGFDRATLEVVDLRDGTRKVVQRGGFYGRYVESGHLLYATANSLFAVAFDLSRLEVVGSAVPVIDDLSADPGNGGAQYSVSRNGTLVYRAGLVSTATYPVAWVDRRGGIDLLINERRTYAEPRLSSDGGRVAFMEFADDNWDVWTYDLSRGIRSRLTFAEGIEGPAVWSPDNQHLIFSSDRDGPDDLYRKRADGAGAVERLTEAVGASLFVSDWSHDGRYVIFTRFGPSDDAEGWKASADIGYVDLQEDNAMRVFLATDFDESEASLSPDGRWLAYQSPESGRDEVYVRPFPEAGGKWQVSDNGGAYPRWAPDGSELYYRDNTGLVGAEITTVGNAFSSARPTKLFDGIFRGGLGGLQLPGGTYADYAVGNEGRFMLFPDPDAVDAVNVELAQVVVNWFQELRRLAPVGQ
jgi:serine/threonine-protein kinase